MATMRVHLAERDARAAALAARAGDRRRSTDQRRGIVDKAYHFIEVMHQASTEGVIGMGMVIGRKGLTDEGQNAITSQYTTVNAKYVHEKAAVAPMLSDMGGRNAIGLLQPSPPRARAGAGMAMTGTSVHATAPTATSYCTGAR